VQKVRKVCQIKEKKRFLDTWMSNSDEFQTPEHTYSKSLNVVSEFKSVGVTYT